MNSISNYSFSLFSKDSILNFTGTLGAGLLSSRFLPISIKEAGVVSTATATFSTMGQALVGKDGNPFKKSLLTIGAFALTYFGTTALAPTLAARFAITLTPQLIGKILAFNALGHVVSFGIAKVLFVTSWNRSDDQIKTLHETYTKDTELFTKLPAIEQQLIVQRFKKLELDVTPFTCEKPSDEEIATLSASEVRTLHEHEVALEDDALLLRYFELDLKPFKSIEERIRKVGLKQPETVEEVKGLSEEKLAWYKLYYAKNRKARRKLPYDVQWALRNLKCTTSSRFNAEYLKTAPDAQIQFIMASPSLTWWVRLLTEIQKVLVERAQALEIEIPHPVHPKTPEEVEKLGEEVVKAYNKNFPKGLDKEIVKAFNQRFYDMKLPLPNGLTIDKLQNDKRRKWPEITLTIPATPKAVQELDDNQLPWLYASIHHNRGFSGLSFELQSALNVRFNKVQTCRYFFSFQKLTPENVQHTSKDVISILHSQLHRKTEEWEKLSVEVIGALDARFAEQFPADKLSEEQVRAYHMLFVKKPECWSALTKTRQQALRQAFDKIPELTELRVKWW